MRVLCNIKDLGAHFFLTDGLLHVLSARVGGGVPCTSWD